MSEDCQGSRVTLLSRVSVPILVWYIETDGQQSGGRCLISYINHSSCWQKHKQEWLFYYPTPSATNYPRRLRPPVYCSALIWHSRTICRLARSITPRRLRRFLRAQSADCVGRQTALNIYTKTTLMQILTRENWSLVGPIKSACTGCCKYCTIKFFPSWKWHFVIGGKWWKQTKTERANATFVGRGFVGSCAYANFICGCHIRFVQSTFYGSSIYDISW